MHSGRRRSGPHKPVQRLIEKGLRECPINLVGQVTAEGACTGRWIVWLADFGKQKQPHIVKGPGADDYQIGGLKNVLAGGIAVNDAPRNLVRAVFPVDDLAYPSMRS
jgi:hypothetical protein